ncbi:g7823 [Coccomyxa elongata]
MENDRQSKNARAQELGVANVDAVEEYGGGSSNPFVRACLFLWSFLVPGLGMFAEAYIIFSVGNLKPLFTAAYPQCWKTYKACNKQLIGSVSYTQIAGIIVGMLSVGFIADRIGRKRGSVLTASIMFIGSLLLTVSSGPNVAGLFTMFIIVQIIFGIGVGGEYPVASSTANEMANSFKSLRNYRGRTVVLVFSNQGLGNLVNTAVILALMAITGQYGPKYSQKSIEIVWRVSYAIITAVILFMLLWRIFGLKETAHFRNRSKGRVVSFNNRKMHVLLGYFSSRIFASSITWFVNDFAFYGNKLFQGTFIKIINPSASLIQVLEWTLLNSFVAYIGYILAAYHIDKKWMGRMRLQSLGFLMSFILFICCGAAYHQLIHPSNIHWFQALYYLASFFAQYGPNCTTWLIAAELIPTETRAMAHGWAAAVGKVGAIVAGLVLERISDQAKFIVSAIAGIIGFVITILFVPDTTHLDLVELDRYWDKIMEGKPHEYHGEAVNPKNLSLWERLLGRGKHYDPVADAADKKNAAFGDDHKQSNELASA